MKKHFLFFFFDDFHQGAVNHLLHAVGFTLLGYGLGRPSLTLIILSPIVMELGHLYNYLRGRDRDEAIRIIPWQLLAWVIFVAIGFAVAARFN